MDGSPHAGSLVSGVMILLGAFALLCAVFGAVATLADWLHGSPSLRTDLQIVAVALFAGVALVALGRLLAAHERRMPHPDASPDAPQEGRSVGAGVLSLATGLYIIGMGAWKIVATSRPLGSEELLVVPMGATFLFAGLILMLPRGREGLRHLFGALLMTAFAITFDWVAFGPGERHFTGGASIGLGVGLGLHPGEWLGRAVFSIPAAITTIVAALGWSRLPSSLRRPR